MKNNWAIDEIIDRALEEDIGPGDVTTQAVLLGNEMGTARAVAKAEITVAGLEIFRRVFLHLDSSLNVTICLQEGENVLPGTTLAEVSGNLSSILTAERTALNFLQRMSGIATLTKAFVEAIAGTEARILDTRKTAPGLRLLDKYAVRIGGGTNHRFALFDGILIKDNHITAAGGIKEAINRVHRFAPFGMKIEIEVKNTAELAEAIEAGADIVMLDNMPTEEMAKAVSLAKGKVKIEASGNITLKRVREVAETGVDFISAGCLTHSATAADISLIIEKLPC